MRKIGLPGWCPEIKKVSRWVLGNMQYNVLLSNVAAINETLNAASIIRERPDLYRQRTKQVLNMAMRLTETLKHTYMAYTNHPDLFDEFSEHIIDVTEEDTNRLRNLIRKGIEVRSEKDAGLKEWMRYRGDSGCGRSNAEIIAWIDAALLLLHLAGEHYNVVIQEGNSRGLKAVFTSDLPEKAKEEERRRLDYGSLFSAHNPHGLLAQWQKVHGLTDPVPDILIEEDVLEQMKAISRNYGQGVYLKQCIAAMKGHPAFDSVVTDTDTATHNQDNESVDCSRN